MLNGVVAGRFTTEIWFKGCEGLRKGSLTAVGRIPSSSIVLSTKRVLPRFLRCFEPKWPRFVLLVTYSSSCYSAMLVGSSWFHAGDLRARRGNAFAALLNTGHREKVRTLSSQQHSA